MSLHPRVLMFGWELPPHNSGGLGVACYGLTKGLSQQGAKVYFALPRRFSAHIPFMHILEHDLQGVELIGINSILYAYQSEIDFQTTYEQLNQEELNLYGNSLYAEAMRYGEMAAAWSRRQPHDVIHAHDWMTYPAAINAKQISGKPMIAHIHATEYDRTGGAVNQLISDLEYKGLHAADRVIAVSDYTKRMIHQYYHVPLDKVDVVHNGVDITDFKPKKLRKLFPKDKVVLFVGRLTFQKGIEYFLQAAKQVLAKQPNTIFLIVGHGDLYEKLILEASKLGIGDRVVFPGFLKGQQLQDCYDIADVFVMPSVSEPYGIVALEAVATATPAVISKQSGVVESLKHVFKVDFWDTSKMAQMIATLLKYPKLAKKMAGSACQEARSMTWDKAAGKTLAVYQQIM